MALSSNEGESSDATFFRRRNRLARDRRRRPVADRASVELKCGNPHGYWCFERSGLATVARIHKPAHEGGLGFRVTLAFRRTVLLDGERPPDDYVVVHERPQHRLGLLGRAVQTDLPRKACSPALGCKHDPPPNTFSSLSTDRLARPNAWQLSSDQGGRPLMVERPLNICGLWWPALPVAYCSQAGYTNENLLRVSVSAARSAVAYSTSAAGGSSGHTGGRLARAACLASPSVIFSICSTVYP